MECQIDHISINVKNLELSDPFYHEFLVYLGFKRYKDDNAWVNATTGVWINETERNHQSSGFHRRNTGVNHVAFRVDSRKAVDDFYKNMLVKNNMPVLYGGPKDYPEYHRGYYAVFFEDPDRLKLEVMWMDV
jgi:catechol 2,3-dioxygenase-like lactoylglutathione lyase family enzyme